MDELSETLSHNGIVWYVRSTKYIWDEYMFSICQKHKMYDDNMVYYVKYMSEAQDIYDYYMVWYGKYMSEAQDICDDYMVLEV